MVIPGPRRHHTLSPRSGCGRPQLIQNIRMDLLNCRGACCTGHLLMILNAKIAKPRWNW